MDLEENLSLQVEDDIKVDLISSETTDGVGNENKNIKGNISEDGISSETSTGVDDKDKIKQREARIMDRLHCPTCLRTFSDGNKSYYLKHIKICGKGKFDCSVCNKNFSSPSVLKRHMKSHLKLNIFPCNSCPSIFASKFSLKLHLNKVHEIGRSGRSSNCPHCGKQFQWRSSLSRHVMDEHCNLESLAFQCVCGQKFPKYSRSYQHKKSCEIYQKHKFKSDKKVKEFAVEGDSNKMKLCFSGQKLEVEIGQNDEVVAKSLKRTSDKEIQDKGLDQVENNVEEMHKCQLCNQSFIERQLLDDHVEQCDPYAVTFKISSSYSEAEEDRKYVKIENDWKDTGKGEKSGKEGGHDEVIESIDTSCKQHVDNDESKGMTVVPSVQETNSNEDSKMPNKDKSDQSHVPANTNKSVTYKKAIKRKALGKANAMCVESNISDLDDSEIIIKSNSDQKLDRSRSGRKRKKKTFDDYETDFSGLRESFKSRCVPPAYSDSKKVTETEVKDHNYHESCYNKVEKDTDSKMGKNGNTGVRFLCPLCTETDESVDTIQAHIKKQHDIGKLSWVVLTEKYSKMGTGDKDPASRVKQGQTVCRFCQLDLPTTELLKLHLNRQHAYFPYCCGICRLAYGTIEAARFHMKKYHINRNAKNVCIHCPEVFRTLRDLKKHTTKFHKRTKHKNERPDKDIEENGGKPSSVKAKSTLDTSLTDKEGYGVRIKLEVDEQGKPVGEKEDVQGVSVTDSTSRTFATEVDEQDEMVDDKLSVTRSKAKGINENVTNGGLVKSAAGKEITDVKIAPIIIKSARVIPKKHGIKSEKNVEDCVDTQKELEKKKENLCYRIFDTRKFGVDLPNTLDVKTKCDDSDINLINAKGDTDKEQTSSRFEVKPKALETRQKNFYSKPNCNHYLFDFDAIKNVSFKCCFGNCEQVVECLSDWKAHLSQHKPCKPRQLWQCYECIECGYSTVHKNLLKSHLLIKHNVLESVEIGMKHCQVVDRKSVQPVKVIACVFCGFLKDIQHFTKKHKCYREKIHFYCPFCDQKSRVFEKLQEHIKKEHFDKTIHRPDPGDKFQSLRTAERDPAYSINSTDTTCGKCKQEFGTNDELKLHVNAKHGLGAYSCGVCRQCYGRMSGVKDHMRKTHSLPMVCQHCKRGFGDKADLNRHEATHLTTKPFQCKLCHSRYSDQKGLTLHYKTKHPEKSVKLDGERVTLQPESEIYICDTCGLTFQTFSKYTKHAGTHKLDDQESLPQFNCEICSKVFTSRNAYRRHLCTSKIDGSEPVIIEGYNDSVQSVKDIFHRIKQNPTPGTQAKVRCGLCNRDFNKNKYMYNHIRQVHLPNEGRKMHCGICGSGFARRTQLQSHMRSHLNSKPYRCRICGNSYRQLGHIKVHLLSHSRKLNFKCKLCPQVFKSKSSLGNHILLHCEIFPYKCLVVSCDKAFASLQHLFTHVRHCDANQNSINRFECKICSLRLEDLKCGLSHMKGHGKDALYRCDLCSIECVSYKRLYDHKAKSNHFSPSEIERAASRSCNHQNFTSVEVSEDVDLKTLQQQFDYTPDAFDTEEIDNTFESEADLGAVEESCTDNVIQSEELMDIAQQLTHMAQRDVLNAESVEMKEYAGEQNCIVEQVDMDVEAYNVNFFPSTAEKLPTSRTKESYQNSSLTHKLIVIDNSDSLTEDLLHNQNKSLVQYKKLNNSDTSAVSLKHEESKKTAVPNTRLYASEQESCHVKVLSSHPVINESAVLVEEQLPPRTQLESCLSKTSDGIEDKVQKTFSEGKYEIQFETGVISEEIIASSKIFDETGREVKVNVINEEGHEIPIQSNPELLQALLTTGSYTLGSGNSACSMDKEVSYLAEHVEGLPDAEVIQKRASKGQLESMDFTLESNTEIEDAVNIYVINEVHPVDGYSDSAVTRGMYDSVQKTKKPTPNKLQSKRKILNVDKVCGEIIDKEAKIGNCKMENGQINYKVRLCYYEDRSKQEDLYPLKCDICHHRFRRIKDLNQHKKRHLPDEEKQFQCKDCGKGFTTKHSYRSHMFSHSGDRPHKCNQCDKSFRQVGHLQTHLRTHAKYKPFKCTHCEKTFVTNSQLKKHVETHGTHFNESSANGIACPVCGNFFANEKDLSIHRIKHMSTDAQDELIKNYNAVVDDKPKGKKDNTEQKESMCDICGKLFNRSSDLKAHKEIHFSGPKVACKECGSEFISERRLQTHVIQCHSVEGLQCDTCGKQLKSMTSFYAHKRLHKGPKFQCARCEKTFLRKYLFLKHMAVCFGDEFLQNIQ